VKPTRVTEIAALEAQRNEAAVLAEGALLGERRAAWARLAMITMFGIVTSTGAFHLPSFLLGAAYTLFAVITILVTRRLKRPSLRDSIRRPLVLTFVDFTTITLFALFDRHYGVAFAPARHAIAAAILLTFSVARVGLWQVAWSLALAELSLFVSAGITHMVGIDTFFMAGGYAVLAFMVGLTNVAVRTLFGDLRRRDNLTRFLPQQVVDRIVKGGTAALAPVQREVSVLFSDIRGFTGLSETLAPRALLLVLDDYFGRMGQIVKGHDGVIGKFIGDGLLAYWNVPDTLDHHAARAVAAARDMQKAMIELNRIRADGGEPPIKIGIGIHTGIVAAGMLGGASQSEYTVIGDAVNVASRIEGLTKEHGAPILISETTWLQLAEPRPGRRIDGVPIRGRKEPIALYAIEG
jgi:adenylate cyclase